MIGRQEIRRQVIEEAFGIAAQAQHPVRISFEGASDNRVWAIYNPLDLKLDKLSLQVRAIRSLLKFDKVRARQLFLNEMPPEIGLPPLGCEDAVRSYRVADYYDTAGLLFRETFTVKERAAPGFAYTLLPFVDRISSPAQVDPVAKMIAALKLNAVQLSMLGAAYAQALKKVGNDDLTFRVSMQSYQGVKDLINALDISRGNSS